MTPDLTTTAAHEAEAAVTRQRLVWSASTLVAVVILMLIGEPVARSHWILAIGNLGLLLLAATAAIGAWRGWWRVATMHALGAGLLTIVTALTLIAHELHPDQRFAIMLVLQVVGASVLFLSTRWLIAYLVVAVVASTAVAVDLGRSADATLVVAATILGVALHVALQERQRRWTRAHAAQLAEALAEARQQLADKERAEEARAEAQRDSESYQAQLLQAQKMEAIGTLAGGVAHDMNNALAAIIGFAECINTDATEAEVRDDAEQILLAARRAADLTRNLLGFSRRGQFHREPNRPESVITGLATLLARTLPKGIKVETTFADRLASFDVDTNALTHALVNLCLNASDAMAGEGVLTLGARLENVTVEAGRALGVAPGRYVALSVRDTGHGMAPEVQARIFEPFFTTKAQGQGTGLGLAMVYGTVKRHEGAVVVDSAPGHGSLFTLYLPAAAAAPISHPELAPVTAPAAGPSGHGDHILIIDDEAMVRTVMARALQRAGYVVETAANGQLGLELLARAEVRFELLILDMAMPVMAGPETFLRVRRLHPDLKVLLASGFISSEDARGFLAAGARGLLEKPFTPDRLLAVVAQVLDGRPPALVGAA